jgi:sugar lactone lactonase YvrE
MTRCEDPAPGFERFVAGLVFPEAPRWHDGRLWLSDIHAHAVVCFDAAGIEHRRITFGDRVCGLGFLPDGSLLVVSMFERCVLRVVDGGRAERYADLAPWCSGFLNDMVVDTRGFAYVGARNPPSGSGRDEVLVVAPDRSVSVAAAAMWSPNGSVVTDGGATLVVAETSAARLTAFDIAGDGSLGARRVLVEVPGRHPDGIALDVDGGIWFGSPMTEELVKVDAAGAVVRTIPTPGVWAVACAVGGAEGRTLYAVVGENSVENLTRLGADTNADHTSTASGAVWTFQL